ncbi:DUF402 domain-containing protein [Oceanotoga sp. DSM 15011]|jgi:hypothetical protein|uniref:DUF402 domain-containing protein n=1 Tax=Oceanotoga teriensis TaxID=515440 RepID=A0AA45C8P1_9BACT|nr:MULTISPECIES: DUF402 domain-containing protein [Oceanotoga]MDN5342419.1 uncharacterized protein [Oceanotoga sp.]MDO7975500.1 DUF402 domain-containing protein [Oceanotoga teriensis]PWJ96212.1 hypothetical protein C7380_102126 [Oceanotoga teriensis]UYO99995.1 DUF402 domain-containing protein [Oceanotoga sp. DSM 15011]
MKSYNFDIKNKAENIKTHINENKFDFTEFREFNQHILGFKRNWEKLSTHNSVDYVKRILNPQTNLMLSYFKDISGDMANYLIYIDFGKYKSSKDNIFFYDLELDILITKEFKYRILDMDELLDSYFNKRINDIELNIVLNLLQKLMNDFQSIGPINALKNIFGAEPIDWILDN